MQPGTSVYCRGNELISGRGIKVNMNEDFLTLGMTDSD